MQGSWIELQIINANSEHFKCANKFALIRRKGRLMIILYNETRQSCDLHSHRCWQLHPSFHIFPNDDSP